MQRTKDEVRIRILNAAIKEFKLHNYEGASIRNIAKYSKISTGNIYRYFHNKSSIFLAVINPVLEFCLTLTDTDYKLTKKGLDITAENMVNYFLKYKDIFEIIQNGPVKYYNAFIGNLTDCISRKIETYVNQNYEVEKIKIVNPRFFSSIASCYIVALRTIMEQPINEETKMVYSKELLHYLFDDMEQRIC